MAEIPDPGEKILISNMDKVGILHLQGVEKYLERQKIKFCFLITPLRPHDNVLKYAEHIPFLKIVISSDFQVEKKKIEKEYPDAKIISVDPYQLAGREGMLDGD